MRFGSFLKDIQEFEQISKSLMSENETSVSNNMSIHKMKDKTVVLINLAGYRKEDVSVSVIGKYSVSVYAERKFDFEFTPNKFCRKESFQIPDETLDFESIEASMDNGLLFLTIPVKTNASKVRSVQIK